MSNKRLLIGIVLFFGSFALIKVGLMTSILGPMPPAPVDLRAMWQAYAPAQKLFVVACFFASAYGAGMIFDSLIRLLKGK